MLRTREGLIQTIQDRAGMLEQRVVIRLKCTDSRDNSGEAAGFGHRNASDIKEMHEGAYAGQRRIGIEPKACQQYLESHLRVDVRECRAIKIKADRPLRLILDALQPDKFGFSVDETTDEPRGADPIDP